jgi:hypothetical protein
MRSPGSHDREQAVQSHGLHPLPYGFESDVARPTVNDEVCHMITPDGGLQTNERLRHRRRDRPGSFHLDENERAIAGRHHEIDLQTLLISEIVDVQPAAMIDLLFDDLRCDKPFKERSEKGRTLQLATRTDAEEMACEAGIGEIELGRLDQTFTEILVERNHNAAAPGRATTSGKPPRTTDTLECSDDENGRSCRTAARPAIDSVTPRINGASCDPVSSHCPVFLGAGSMRGRT